MHKWWFSHFMEDPPKNTKKKTKTKQKLLLPINKFSQVIEYKINIQKSVVFLYTSNEGSPKEIKNLITFVIAFRRIKYLGINLTKGYERHILKTKNHSWN